MKKLIAIITILALGSAIAAPKLPKGLKWQNGMDQKVFTSKEAKIGGTFRNMMQSFPLTLRNVGPDSNAGLRGAINESNLSLFELHPDTLKPIPVLATDWALGKDQKTIYYKLNKKARWSDGKPVTAKDFAYALEFMRSKHIVAPWYNNHYTEYFDKVEIYDSHTFAIKGKKKKSDFEMLMYYNLTPVPAHYYKPILNKDWTKKHNWSVVPNNGPYQINPKKIKKGKSVVFERKMNWWANDLKFMKNRYNYKRIKYTVIRDINLAYEHFKKGRLDVFGLVLPNFWHKKAKGKEYDKGYINRIWYYNDVPQPSYGVRLNQDKWPFGDINVRKAFAHSLNVNKVTKIVLRGDYERLNSYGEGTGKFSNKKIRARKFDPKKVTYYMKKAGWTRDKDTGLWKDKAGKLFIVDVMYGAPTHTERIVVLKEEAMKAGIKLNLKMMDGAASFKAMLEKQHQVAWLGMSANMIPGYRQSFHSATAHKPQTNNFTNTDDKQIDKMIEAYRNEFNDNKKQALSRKIQQRIHDLSAFIPTYKVPYFREGYWAWMKYPKTLGKTFNSVTSYGVAWIDTDLKKKIKKMKRSGKQLSKPVLIKNTKYRTK